MKFLLSVLALFSCLLIQPLTSQAISIVDTGPGEQSIAGYALYTGQWLAAEFSLDQDYYITDIEAWVANDNQTGNMFTISVYDDGGDVPGGNLLYSNGVTISGTNMQANWEGYNISFGNGLELLQGTYWLGFELRTINYNNPYDGAMPFSSQFPLANEAYNNQGFWVGDDYLNMGVRISGTPMAPVPEPSTMILLGIGLAGLAGVQLKRKKQ